MLPSPACGRGAGGEGPPAVAAETPPARTDRRIPYAPGLRFTDDAEHPLVASVYSLPSFFFDAKVAETFLSAVRQAAPDRELLVLVDPPLRKALEPRAAALRLRLLETHGRAYSPWPRDPFSLVRSAQGGVVVVVRPNVQPGREDDAFLGAELVQDLPEDLDRAWGRVTWTEAPVPFHNGQILPAENAAWITLHSLEPRILALLGLPRVPVETFGSAAGVARYVEAAGKAARELSDLWGRPVRFVHPLPGVDAPANQGPNLLRRIGGGAGYDLDSLVTLLPSPGGKAQASALVADVTAGRELLARLPAAEWSSLRSGWGLAPEGDRLAADIAAAQRTPHAGDLDTFLDLTAEHLAAQGFRVRRLPILSIPFDLLQDPGGLQGELLLTWNNVVAETRDGKLRAEGFSSLLPSGDRAATEVFAAAGAHLDLFPPLVRSVILNGGYRCASNHLRATNRR